MSKCADWRANQAGQSHERFVPRGKKYLDFHCAAARQLTAEVLIKTTTTASVAIHEAIGGRCTSRVTLDLTDDRSDCTCMDDLYSIGICKCAKAACDKLGLDYLDFVDKRYLIVEYEKACFRPTDSSMRRTIGTTH